MLFQAIPLSEVAMSTAGFRQLMIPIVLGIGRSLAASESSDPAALFRDRILPILKSEHSSSCTECHFVGVELRDYLREDQAETFASLRAAGLIDVDNPDASKLLTFINRKPEKPNPLLDRVREQESAAFRDWIRAAVRDPELLKMKAEPETGLTLPVEVVRHARKDRVVSSFVDNVWSEMARCQSCHSPEKNRDKIKKLGQDYVDSISWLVPNDPAATIQRLEDDANIDIDNPEQSPFLLKPAGLVKHGGGPKFVVGDAAYRKFLAFLNDYAAIRTGRYQSASDLPPTASQLVLLTRQHLRITGFPEGMNGTPLRVVLYARDEANGGWSSEPVGEVAALVSPKQPLAQGMVSVILPASAPDLATLRKDPLLPKGPLLARLYLDRDGRTQREPLYDLGEKEYVGQLEIAAEWPPGYQPPMVVELGGFK